jgi:FkbH-like protein
MKLIEALDIVNAEGLPSAPARIFFLACGFEPLHLQTFLNAHLQLRLGREKVTIQKGLFGDLVGNIRRAGSGQFAGCAVIIEWPDLDPRLGFRESASWRPESLSDVLDEASKTLDRLEGELDHLAKSCRIVLTLPSLPLPPLSLMPAHQSNAFELELGQQTLAFGLRIASHEGICVINNLEGIAREDCYDIRSDLLYGVPYTQAHADQVACAVASLLNPAPIKKGIVTDLDDTLWKGILGDDGVEGVSWDLAGRARIHGIYQQLLAALANRGVLVAVASKNDPALVRRVFDRPGLCIRLDHIFPFSVHWRPKSESLTEILKSWNIGASEVVFIDDNPMELAEVKAAHPLIECLRFPSDPGKLPHLIHKLREWFGRPSVSSEDRIRTESIRAGAAWQDAESRLNDSFEGFLSEAEAQVTVVAARSEDRGRAFELLNKTNQFNLNGKRYTESEWIQYLKLPGSFLATLAYEDKFGPLGIVSVALGRTENEKVRLDSWVLSCRAFGRRVEHQFVNTLFQLLSATEMVFEYEATDRNCLTREFLASFGPPAPHFCLTKQEFGSNCPVLYHTVRSATV